LTTLRRPSSFRVERFAPERLADFDRVHSDERGAGWCKCVAWWVPTWDGFGARTAEQNASLRRDLCERGEWDGLLAYDGDDAIGWCQVGPRDRLQKLVSQLGLPADPDTWAVTCFLVAPGWRRRGVARALLAAAVRAARDAGARRIEGYPAAGGSFDDDDAWTGTASMFDRAGFAVAVDSRPRLVVSLDLGS